MFGGAIRVLGGLIKLMGNTTGTPIGNALDALKVTLRNSAGNEVGTPADPIFVEFPENADRIFVNTQASTSVPSGVPTTAVSYTVPALTDAVLEKITVSGENIAKFTVKVNGTDVDVKRTYFGGNLNVEFDFLSKASLGYPLVAGDIVTVEVLQTRGSSANYEARIQVVKLN